jgi:hypothetical protein
MKVFKALAVIAICLGAIFAMTGCTSKKDQTSSGSEPGATPAVTPGPNSPMLSPVVPVDVSNGSNASQNDWYNFGWQTFVALDWPALSGGSLGQPNTGLKPGASVNGAFIPAVWATYRDVSTVMLANAANPGDWNTPQSVPSACNTKNPPPVAPGFQPMVLDGSTFKGAPLTLDYVNQATDNPLVDQAGWYTIADIRIDQSEYAFIQQNSYFSGQAQIKAVNSKTFAPFPRTGQPSDFKPPITLPAYAQYGALEVKTTWRVLDPTKDQNIIPRYYTQWGYFVQPDRSCSGPTLFGLIALHILRLTPTTPATWYWATFEQVDNTTAPPAQGAGATLTPANPAPPCPTLGYSPTPAPPKHTGNVPWTNTNTANNICRVEPVPSAVQQVNSSWQAALAGTVWQYYAMDGTINPCPPGASGCVSFHLSSAQVNTGVLANTAIESYGQATTSGVNSCLDCHAYAAPQPDNSGPPDTSLQIFTFVLQNAFASSSQTPTSRKRFVELLKQAPHRPLSKAEGGAAKDKYKQ